MKKIISITGTRPQIIKLSAISGILRQHFNEVVIHSGQHYDYNMSDCFFEQLEMPSPKYHLSIKSKGHAKQTGYMMIEMEEIFIKEKPDLILVFGDTNTTLAAALAAKKLNIKIAHIEAGERSDNMQMAEQVNRVITDILSDIHFCASEQSKINLDLEGIYKYVYMVGDIMKDVLLKYEKEIKEKKGDFILLTLHRAENINKKNIKKLFKIIETLDKDIIFPAHPRTSRFIEENNINIPSNLTLTEPVNYFQMISFIKSCECVMTDSGGLQKDAYYLKKPCITLREETEWKQTKMDGWNIVTGIEKKYIMNAIKSIPDIRLLPHNSMLYGKGKSGKEIVKLLTELL